MHKFVQNIYLLGSFYGEDDRKDSKDCEIVSFHLRSDDGVGHRVWETQRVGGTLRRSLDNPFISQVEKRRSGSGGGGWYQYSSSLPFSLRLPAGLPLDWESATCQSPLNHSSKTAIRYWQRFGKSSPPRYLAQGSGPHLKRNRGSWKCCQFI